MKNFVNELFSIEVDPPKGKQGKSITYAAYEDGSFLVSTAAAFSMEEATESCECFRVTSPKDLQALLAFGKKQKEIFHDVPDMLVLPNYTGSAFTLSINGKMSYGSYHRYDALKQTEGGESDPRLQKALLWDNRVVDLIEGMFALVQSFASSQLIVRSDAPEKDYLRPVPRYLFHLLANDEDIHLKPCATKEDCIKAAAKEAFQGNNPLEGSAFNACFSLIAQNAIPLLSASVSRAQFDQGHAALVKEMLGASLGKIRYAQAAYWLDLTYVRFLLTESVILSETKAALLHAPVKEEILQEENKAVDEASYVFFQSEGRKEWSLLHISPVYFYLEGLYSSAHPIAHPDGVNRA